MYTYTLKSFMGPKFNFEVTGAEIEGERHNRKQTKSIKFSEFMSGEYKEKDQKKKAQNRAIVKAAATTGLYATALKISIPVAAVTLPLFLTTKALAAGTIPPAAVPAGGIMSEAIKEKIIHSFDPLIELMVGLSIPIAGVMITGGALLVLIGRKDAGFGLIMNAALGYVLVQLSPLLIDLLVGIGGAV